MIILVYYEENQEERLLSMFHTHKGALGVNMVDIKSMDPLICTHLISLEDYIKSIRQMQGRLNLAMKEVVEVNVLKLLDACIIYPIVDCN